MKDMYHVSRIYMVPTKSDKYDDSVFEVKHTKLCEDKLEAFLLGMELLEEVYEDIKTGKITFNFIKDFNPKNVILNSSKCSIYYNMDREQYSLCGMINHDILTYRGNIYIGDNENYKTFDYAILKHGLFMYVVYCYENPIIVKRFWVFTKIDKIINWIFTKFENTALEV